MIYFLTFLQSNLLEVPFYGAALKPWSWARRVAFVTIMNSVTHPFVFFALMRLPYSRLSNILIAEGFAVGAEAVIFTRVAGLNWRRAAGVSLLANLVSWQLGPLLTYWLWMR